MDGDGYFCDACTYGNVWGDARLLVNSPRYGVSCFYYAKGPDLQVLSTVMEIRREASA